MKKTIPLLLASALLFVGCGDDTKPTPEERTTEQLLARISELEEENRTLKQQVGTQEDPVANEEIEQQAQEPQEETSEAEESQSSDEPESANSDVQYIQSQPGTSTSDKYFKLEGRYGIYEQTGDMFTTIYEYDNSQILVIPIKFTNTSDEPTDPRMAIIGDYTAKQEDDNQEYLLMGGQGSTPEEYDNPIDIKVKPGGETEWYLSYTLSQPNQDVLLIDDIKDELVYTFKFQ